MHSLISINTANCVSSCFIDELAGIDESILRYHIGSHEDGTPIRDLLPKIQVETDVFSHTSEILNGNIFRITMYILMVRLQFHVTQGDGFESF